MSDQPFVTILADPPWQYRDRVHAARVAGVKAADYGQGADKIRGRRGADGYYPTMPVQAICDLYTPSQVFGGRGGKKSAGTLVGYSIADNAHLYLWVTNAFMEEGHQVCRAWGFFPRTILTWIKPQIGMGSYFRNNTEHVIFATRGKLPLQVKNQPTAFTASRSKKHSEKPDVFYEIIERCSPGPRLELFARRERPGWISWGNEVGNGGRAVTVAEPALPLEPVATPPHMIIHPEPLIEWP